MAKDPATRYRTCRELIAAAGQALAGGRPPGAGPGMTMRQPTATFPSHQQSSTADPVRLRPPVPAGSTAFTTAENEHNRWVAPLIVGVVAIALIVGAILWFSSGDDNPGGGGTPTSTTTSSVARIPVGTTGGQPTQSAPSIPGGTLPSIPSLSIPRPNDTSRGLPIQPSNR